MLFYPLFTDERWSSISATKVIWVHCPSLTWIWSHEFSFIDGNFSHLTNSISEFIQSSISICCLLSVILWGVWDIVRNVPPESLAGYKPFKNTFSGEHKWLLIAKSAKSATHRVNGFHLCRLMYIAKSFSCPQRPAK